MAQFIPSSPFVAKLGIVAEVLDGRRGAAAHAVGPDQRHGRRHGARRCDRRAGRVTVMAAAWAGAEVPDSLRGVTTSMSMQFLAPARATDLIAVGRVLRRGKTLVNCDVDVVTPDGERSRRRSPPTRSAETSIMVKQLAASRNIASARRVGEEQRGVPWPPSFSVARLSAPPHSATLAFVTVITPAVTHAVECGSGDGVRSAVQHLRAGIATAATAAAHRRRPRRTAISRRTSRSVSARLSRSCRCAPGI